jgi:hypothetical protein
MEKIYKNHLITKVKHNGYFYAITKNGRVMADTLKGIKELINKNL